MASAGPCNTALDGVDIELLEPLERAAGAGDADATASLLASGTTVPFRLGAAEGRPLRRAILHWAAFGGNPNVVTAVLEAVASSGAAPDGVGAAGAQILVLRAWCLSEAGGLRGTTPLHLASKHGHVAAAIILLEAGANDALFDEDGQPPLALAVTAGHDEMVVELLNRGSLNVDDILGICGSRAIHLAADKGHVGMVEMLLRKGAETNVFTVVKDESPLHLAVQRGPNAEAITMALLAAGADVNAVNDTNGSALTLTSDLAVMRVLLVAGADPHWRTDYGRISSVEMAVKANNVEGLSLFLELEVDPNHRGPFNKPFIERPPFDSPGFWGYSTLGRRRYGGASLLHRAARSLSNGAVELLLAAGAREDIPALKDIQQEHAPEIFTLPIDVIGVDVKEMTPELQRRADTIRSMLAGAHLYRKGWLSVLRTRFEAGKSLTGSSDGGAEGIRGGGGGGSGGGEGPSPRRQRGEPLHSSGACDFGGFAVEDEAWYGAAVWIARVPGPEVFRIITEYL